MLAIGIDDVRGVLPTLYEMELIGLTVDGDHEMRCHCVHSDSGLPQGDASS
jgi:hypothetical protein